MIWTTSPEVSPSSWTTFGSIRAIPRPTSLWRASATRRVAVFSGKSGSLEGPECGNPLFRVKGDIFCAKCNKPVVYARATGPQASVSQSVLLETVEQTIVGKISETNALLKLEKDPEKMSVYSNLVFGWLSMLEKLRNLRESDRES